MNETELLARLRSHGQEHLWAFAAELAPEARNRLAAQLAATDFELLKRLHAESRQSVAAIDPKGIKPIRVKELPKSLPEQAGWAEAARIGKEALRANRCAALLVAGGQGSRLGFEHPKGMFPIGPVSGDSLFQIFAEKIRARQRAAGAGPIPWYIMTSAGNRAETEAFFKQHRYFGMKPEDVTFFVQGTMPAIDAETGKALLAGKDELFQSPNGHGGTLTALAAEGVLADLARRGRDLIYFFQVDNPFVEVLEPAFIGHHLRAGAEFSAKVVRKTEPNEKVGLVVLRGGRPEVIEYSDLPNELAEARATDGGLAYWPGSIAIHIFSRGFLERVAVAGLPWHFARKAVPFVDAAGVLQKPSTPNAVKFEMFIFDSMPLAKQVCIVETDRHEEFQPVKNATGADSPESVRKAMTRRAAAWLQTAGWDVATNADGTPIVPVEIGPLAGLDAEDFAARGMTSRRLDGPTHFGE